MKFAPAAYSSPGGLTVGIRTSPCRNATISSASASTARSTVVSFACVTGVVILERRLEPPVDRRPSAVDEQYGSGNVTGRVRAEKYDGPGDLFRLRPTLQCGTIAI